MTKKKYYAVRKGRTIGIFNSWDECKQSVDGYTNAKYKGFINIDDARNYLGNIEKKNETFESIDIIKMIEDKKGDVFFREDGQWKNIRMMIPRKFSFSNIESKNEFINYEEFIINKNSRSVVKSYCSRT